MKILKDKRFYKFLVPSLIGAFLFVTPINQDGSLTIPIAVAANAMLNLMGDGALTIIWALISLSGIITLIHKFIGIGFIAAFVLWTVLVKIVDVEAIGPRGSEVGFSALNGFVHKLLGTNMTLYVITDWLGLVPIATALVFALLGLFQWIKRKSLRRVDGSIIALGIFYLAVIAVYILFEFVVINRRPVLIDGYLEASYPSSTTMLVACVMPSAMMQFNSRIKTVWLKHAILTAIGIFTAFTVIGRLISGVHWLSDIIGGLLFSIGALTLYRAFEE